jgi:hypothetical protein
VVSIAGISSQTFSHLPPEEQRLLRAQEHQHEAPAAPPAPAPAPSRVNPHDAKTPREAVQAIHAMPLPVTTDLASMPASVLDAVYGPRVRLFNRDRVGEAQDAIARLKPRREDFAAAGNPRSADMEYRSAADAYQSDPYVQELGRIVKEGTERPNTVPAYLRNQAESPTPSSALSVDPMRTALGQLGVYVPENATPAQISAGYEILDTIPPSLLGVVISPGTQVGFSPSIEHLERPKGGRPISGSSAPVRCRTGIRRACRPRAGPTCSRATTRLGSVRISASSPLASVTRAS